MAFETYEISEQQGSRVELYTLAMGSDIYRWHTSIEPEITVGGDKFYRLQISRGNIVTGQEYLEVVVPGDLAFPLQFSSIAPGQTATLTIQAYHRGDTADIKVIYKGVVRAVAFTQDTAKATLSLIPLVDAFDMEIPERTYQAPCNHVLFDADCKVSAGLFKHEDTVSAVNDNIVTINGLLAAKGDGWATGGYIAFGVLDYRLVLSQNGDDLTLVLPFHESVLNQTVSVYAGCDHTISTCDSKFNNKLNFGGCPYVPTINIFATGLK